MWAIDLKSRLDLILTIEIKDLAQLKNTKRQQGLRQRCILYSQVSVSKRANQRRTFGFQHLARKKMQQSSVSRSSH